VNWLELPYPPTANNLFRDAVGKNGRRFRVRSSGYLAWLQSASDRISMAGKEARVAGPYTMTVHAGKPDRRRRDVENLLKPISDALVNGGIVEDDSLCQRVSAEWMPGVTGVRVLVLPTKERT
jgi:crossover junction endodeoxyribonuclease RusA